MKKYFATFLLILPAFSLASSTILKNGLDTHAFTQCQAVMQQCPKTGPVLDTQCVLSSLNKNAVCAQTAELSKRTNVSADQITVKNYGNLTLLTLHYPADGKVNYSILADGQLINMAIDPLKTNPTLAAKYKQETVFLSFIGEPTYLVTASGNREISAPIRLTKGCAACAILGTGKVIFHFDAHGKLIASQIVM